jgi:HEPN domain-containing protein
MSTDDWVAMYEDSIQASRDNSIDQKALKELHLAVEAILKAALNEHTSYTVPNGHDTPAYAKRLNVPSQFRHIISYLEASTDGGTRTTRRSRRETPQTSAPTSKS